MKVCSFLGDVFSKKELAGIAGTSRAFVERAEAEAIKPEVDSDDYDVRVFQMEDKAKKRQLLQQKYDFIAFCMTDINAYTSEKRTLFSKIFSKQDELKMEEVNAFFQKKRQLKQQLLMMEYTRSVIQDYTYARVYALMKIINNNQVRVKLSSSKGEICSFTMNLLIYNGGNLGQLNLQELTEEQRKYAFNLITHGIEYYINNKKEHSNEISVLGNAVIFRNKQMFPELPADNIRIIDGALDYLPSPISRNIERFYESQTELHIEDDFTSNNFTKTELQRLNLVDEEFYGENRIGIDLI